LAAAASDIELWNAFKQGDKQAFADLFKRYYALLIRYGLKIHPELATLEDRIQELFVELWQSRSAMEVTSVKAYLLRALKYKLIRLHKKRYSSSQIEDDVLFELSHEDMMINSEEDRRKAIRITEAIKQLPNRQKEIIYLKLYQQLTYEELEEVMQINYQAARNLYYQAVKSLRKLLVSSR